MLTGVSSLPVDHPLNDAEVLYPGMGHRNATRSQRGVVAEEREVFHAKKCTSAPYFLKSRAFYRYSGKAIIYMRIFTK